MRCCLKLFDKLRGLKLGRRWMFSLGINLYSPVLCHLPARFGSGRRLLVLEIRVN